MTLRLLLALALWAGGWSCGGRAVSSSQPRVQCRASRYPVAVDCSWTLPPAPNCTTATTFIATYRLGVAAQGQSRPCLQPTPQATGCTIPDVQLFSLSPYVLNVTAVRPGGASSGFAPFVAEHVSLCSDVTSSEASQVCCQTGPPGGRAPQPPPWAAAAGALGAPSVLALPRGLLSEVLDPIQASGSLPLPPGGAHRSHELHPQSCAAPGQVLHPGGSPGRHGLRGAQ
ncbi:interleukin-27 subunit beta isoform X1 [Ictidomys tridecemlineatus]|uniref:interleukin-27 subunit beta isoform X1 n=1 Tax=Ictidomys tridecemlineatus TaxID=43179 RepID=UPI001A9FA7A1|nr:interleukin-27 subunit beta isoform X1 [Ictidomys tridecemlineatus]